MQPNTTAIITSQGAPVCGATVLMMFPEKTWKKGRTDFDGKCQLYLYSSHLPMTVFVAADDHKPEIVENWRPADDHNNLQIELTPSEVSAIVIPEGTGYIPALEGRLNPIKDGENRTYLYANNIAINEGAAQPVNFCVGEDMSLRDADGNETTIKVMAIQGNSSLIQYTPITHP